MRLNIPINAWIVVALTELRHDCPRLYIGDLNYGCAFRVWIIVQQILCIYRPAHVRNTLRSDSMHWEGCFFDIWAATWLNLWIINEFLCRLHLNLRNNWVLHAAHAWVWLALSNCIFVEVHIIDFERLILRLLHHNDRLVLHSGGLLLRTRNTYDCILI